MKFILGLNSLEGVIRQLTLYGQLEFISDEYYKVNPITHKVYKDLYKVSGKFKIVDTGEVIEASIDMDGAELDKHLK